MEDFVTIASYINANEIEFIKTRLELEGIECFVRDENTIAVHNLLTNAIGGMRLQVKGSDADKAIEILKEIGYIKSEKDTRTKFWNRFENFTSKIPSIKKYSTEARVFILVAFIVIGVSALIAFLMTPSTTKLLTKNSWCIDRVVYNKKEHYPNTIYKDGDTPVTISVNGSCFEKIKFKENGTVIFPGFDTHTISGTWKIVDDKIVISKIDNFHRMLEGSYKITTDVQDTEMKLTSDKTIIYCGKTWSYE